jgi:hypothetical protein
MLEWANAEENADHLIVEYGPSAMEFTDSIIVAGDATSDIITGLQSGTTYYFRIKAVNSTTESAYSQVVAVQTEAVPVPPVACTSPSPADAGKISFLVDVILTWDNTTTHPGGILYYDVYFGTQEYDMVLVASRQTSKSYSVGALDASQTYYWRVSATNDLGSAAGDTWSFTTGSASRARVLYIPFDDTTGTVAENLSGANDACASNLTPSRVPGIQGNCLYFSASPGNACMIVDH